MKKIISLILSAAFALSLCIVPAAAVDSYTDVPTGSWAEDIINKASSYELMQGEGGSSFGYGKNITRAQFVTILCRMFSWELVNPPSPSIPDVSGTSWYYQYIETALSHDVFDLSSNFYPDSYITREDMAQMLVRALGYKEIAQSMSDFDIPFTDITQNEGYISIAYNIGMINGKSASSFAPYDNAKREEAAAMLVRIYEKISAGTDWLHGFYAFSSYSQRYLTDDMNAVSMGWSEMTYDPQTGAVLSTAGEDGSSWKIPDSYESIIDYLDQNQAQVKLSVYMNNSGSRLENMLSSEQGRSSAVDAIINELTRTYEAVSKNPYSGVTIDFEGLKGAAEKENFNLFLSLLSSRLDEIGKSLYVAVQPAMDGEYFDGYDYKTIGELADKVILMAHDYNATDLSGFEGTQYYKTTALTPIDKVYYSLNAITDPVSGVSDRSKIAFAISFSGLAWEISDDGSLVNPSPATPSIDTIHNRLVQADTQIGWSDTYKNPYAIYTTEDGKRYFIWYEDARSVSAKVELARLFDITGVSIWRIGNVPDYDDPGIYYDVVDAVK